MRSRCFGLAAVVFAASSIVLQPQPAQALFGQEFKCSAAVAKSFSKLQSSLLKARSKCHADDISGKANSADNCATLPPDVVTKLEKSKTKFASKVAKACKSVCSISNDIECVSDLTCPPKHTAAPANNAIAERCTGKGGANGFSLRNLDWPGPYCDSILGHAMTSPGDLGECLAELVDTTVAAMDEAVFADLNESSGLTPTAAKCVSQVAKALSKSTGRAYLATADCRDVRRDADDADQPAYACASTDAAVVEDIADAVTSLGESIDKACEDADIALLTGMCTSGGASAPTTVAGAAACLGDLLVEVATAERGYNRHAYSPISMLNATHPGSAAAYCGDGVVTATREEHTGVGEECDGDADAACGAGNCLPPGDLFECTCDTTPRERFVVNGDEAATDSDAGWLGASHEATHNDGFGYVTELSNCTCDVFSQATCTSPSGDDICDVRANMAPRCSDDLNGTDTCDDRGDGDGTAETTDCFRCDDNSINAGTWCANGNNANETLCQSQCFDATGQPVMPQTACLVQTDCGDGQTCKGRCDNTITCNKMTEGSPLPLISAANPVCIMLEYKTDVTGTKNMVTGETAIGYTTRSLISLGEIFREPCPICGGVCIDGANNGEPCFGRCNSTSDSCLFDSDCTGPGDTTCLESAADCTGGFCSLDLRCSTGLNAGELCRPDTVTTLGTVSHDCLPLPNETISGTGVLQPFGTVTTELVEFQAGAPCTNPSWSNYDCPCPADTPPNSGVPTRPNVCSAACDGGVNEGKGCVVGSGGPGVYSTCVGGADAGLPCDADSDCASNVCGNAPSECTASDNNAELGTSCTVNGDCGAGGVCSPSCPGARCVPLCLTEGVCNGGARDGDPCSTLDHCKQCTEGNPSLIGTACDTNSRCNTTAVSGDGLCEVNPGVTCDITDPEDGLCAAGPVKYRCTGAGFTTIPCELHYGTCLMGLCTKGSPSKRGLPCTLDTQCVDIVNVPVSSLCETGLDSLPGTADDIPGAGECEPRPESCYINNGLAEGGDTLNGDGSPSDVNINATFCTPANANPAVNSASGFGGPSRVRRQGSAFVNVPSIP